MKLLILLLFACLAGAPACGPLPTGKVPADNPLREFEPPEEEELVGEDDEDEPADEDDAAASDEGGADEGGAATPGKPAGDATGTR
jgi:hypothetical protein